VIRYDLSEWAKAYVQTRAYSNEMPCRRDARRTCSASELVDLLSKHGLPHTEAIVDFEERVGGWSAEHPPSPCGLGVFLSLQQGEGCSPVADQFRSAMNWFAGEAERRAGPEAWSYSPLRGTGYPRTFFQQRALVPAGMAGQEHAYFLGERGEMYLFISTLDQLYLVAGSGRTLIERWGMSQRKINRAYWEIHVCADVAARVAEGLAVPRFEAACDDYFTVWANDAVQIRLVHDVAPNIFGTHIAVAEADDLLLAVRQLRSSIPARPLMVWSGANNIGDAGGLALLSSEGIDARVLYGPGPGNYEYTIDPETGEVVYAPSNYDSSGWKGTSSVG
jgi:hypothetical protein